MVICGAEAFSLAASSAKLARTRWPSWRPRGKPVYVAAEYQFARLFPLSQNITGTSSRVRAALSPPPPPESIIAEKPSRDYTPPSYITMLFTDLGVLTPSAVSDELIKLFD